MNWKIITQDGNERERYFETVLDARIFAEENRESWYGSVMRSQEGHEIYIG